MRHFIDVRFLFGINAIMTVEESAIHFVVSEHISDTGFLIPVVGVWVYVHDGIQGVFVHYLTTFDFGIDKDVPLLLFPVGFLIPLAHALVVEVAEFIARLQQRPCVSEGVLLVEYVV